MEVFALSGLINVIIAFTISILVFARNRKNADNKVFSLFALSVAMWSFGYWRWLLAANSETALFWIKFLTLPSMIIPALYFHWITLLLEINNKKRFRQFLSLLYFSAIIFIALLLSTNLMIQGVTPKLFFPYWPVPGNLYLLFVGIYFGAVVYSLILLFKSSRGLKDKEKKSQRLFVFLGTLIGFGGGVTTFLLWYDIPIPPYGNFLVSIGLLLWGYAAAKYHLFNIKAVVAEILTFVIWVAVLVELFMADTATERLVGTGLFALVVILGIMIIKSVRKEVEQREKLEKLTEELRAANKLKDEFLSFASHQVKTPMTVIKGYISLIYDGTYGEISKEAKEKAHIIEEMVDRTVRLVGNFLDLRKIEEGKMQYQFGEMDVVGVVGSVIEELKVMAENKKLNLTADLPDKDIKIKADEEKLRQVVQNLLSNAIKYTKEGFVKIELKEKKGSVLIAVSDSGYGISKELLPKLFERFSRDSKVGKQIRGTGLGLYIAKEIVEAHKGRIWVESEGEGEGEGSAFFVRLSK